MYAHVYYAHKYLHIYTFVPQSVGDNFCHLDSHDGRYSKEPYSPEPQLTRSEWRLAMCAPKIGMSNTYICLLAAPQASRVAEVSNQAGRALANTEG